MFRMVLVGIHIFPRIKRALQTNVIIGLGGIGNIDSYHLTAQYWHLIQQGQKSLTDNLCVLYFTMSLCLIQQTEKYNMLNHNDQNFNYSDYQMLTRFSGAT